MVSTLGKIKDGTDDYTFFVTNYLNKAYELKKNVISHQEYVSNFALHDYPITEDDILSRGPMRGFRSEHRKCRQVQHRTGIHRYRRALLYEAITHASNRILYGMKVTDMPHVRKNFMDALAQAAGNENVSTTRDGLLPGCE